MAFESFDVLASQLSPTSLVREVSDEIGILSNEFPTFQELFGRADKIDSTLYEWHDDALRARSITINNTSTTEHSTSETTLDVTTDPTAFLRAGDVLRVRGTGEVMLVLTASTATNNHITVTRGYGGTTAAVIDDSTVADVVSRGWLEAETFSATVDPNYTRRFNTTQIFRYDYQVSGTMESAGLVNGRNGAQDLENKAFLEMIADIGSAIFNSVQPAATQQGSASVRRTMDGLGEMAREGSSAGTGGVFVDATTTDYDDSTSSYDNALSHIRQVGVNGRNPNRFAVSHLQGQRLGRDGGEGMYTQQTDDVVRVKRSIATHYGNVELMIDRGVQQDQAFIFNIDDLALHFERFPTVRVTPSNDATQYSLVAECTLSAMNAQRGSVGVFYDLA